MLDLDCIVVGDVMTHLPPTLEECDSLQYAMARLASQGMAGLPVVRKRNLVGLVTPTSLARRFAALAAEGAFDTRTLENFLRTTVADAMERDVATTGPMTPLAMVLPLLADDAVPEIPVVIGSLLVGVLTRAHLARTVLAGRGTFGSVNGNTHAALTPSPLSKEEPTSCRPPSSITIASSTPTRT